MKKCLCDHVSVYNLIMQTVILKVSAVSFFMYFACIYFNCFYVPVYDNYIFNILIVHVATTNYISCALLTFIFFYVIHAIYTVVTGQISIVEWEA